MLDWSNWVNRRPDLLFKLSNNGLAMVERSSTNIIASHNISGRLDGGCVGSYLGCINWISQHCFLHINLTWNDWDMPKIEVS